MPSPVPVYSLPYRYARPPLLSGTPLTSFFPSDARCSGPANSTWKELPHAT